MKHKAMLDEIIQGKPVVLSKGQAIVTIKNNLMAERQAYVLMLNERFFSRFQKSGRLLSSWSLSGAMLFPDWTDKIQKVELKLKAKGYKPIRRIIQLRPSMEELQSAVEVAQLNHSLDNSSKE